MLPSLEHREHPRGGSTRYFPGDPQAPRLFADDDIMHDIGEFLWHLSLPARPSVAAPPSHIQASVSAETIFMEGIGKSARDIGVRLQLSSSSRVTEKK